MSNIDNFERNVLINHTNHPSSRWCDAQRAGFDKIYDIPFPNIGANLTSVEVLELVSQKISDIAHIRGNVSILLQGEFTYCYLFKQIISTAIPHWQVVVACSERNTVENSDGTKTVRFEFVQYRKV